MEKTELFDQSISNVSATSLITLYCRALESQSKEPILNDPKAVEISQQLNSELSKSDNKLHQDLVKGKIDKRMVATLALRAKRYDQYVKDFLGQSPDGIVVNIGCGLDTRFHRIDDGKVTVYDLDFPELIAVKKRFLEENNRYHFIPSSVLDYEWMEPLLQFHDRSFLFMAEGVFMYLDQEDVETLVLKLQAKFPGSELVCEVFNSFWLKSWLKGMTNIKLQRQLHLGKDVTYNFGIKDSKEMENWNAGIQLLDDWSYFDDSEKKLGVLRLFRHIELFRKMQWTVHYRLN